jgi:O-antigen ligase
MASAQSTSFPEAKQPAVEGHHSGIHAGARDAGWKRLLDPAIFGFLLLFAVLLPHSVKGAERAWKIALILWLLKLAIERVRPYKQPLAAPLLAYVTLSAISTMLSPDPYLSWDRMKVVCLFLAGIVIAQNLKRLSQVRWLVVLLVLSGFGAALFTGWQYTYGVGVRLVGFPGDSRLTKIGIHPDDIIVSFAGHRVHTPEQLVRAVKETSENVWVPVRYRRGIEVQTGDVNATAGDFLQSGLGTQAMKLARGKPIRAQGTLGHYVIFAEMLMQIGCMAWALMFATGRGQRGWRLFFGIAFVGITAALFATETRAAVAGLVLGCLLALLFLIRGAARAMAIVALVAILAGATFWIQHTRKVDWVDRNDIGTHFRVLMWEDGIRLVREHPWFGVGMETVHLHYRKWNIRGFIRYQVQSHFHSTFLQIAVERGIPALLAWLWFSAAYFVLLWRLILRFRIRSRFACGVAAGILASFAAFTFSALVHYNLGEESLAMILFFYYGLAAAMDRLLTQTTAIDVL